MCTIHQPSARIFELFDSVTVLAFGETVYKGTQTGIVPFLKNFGFECPQHHNPADFIIEVASEEHGSIEPILHHWKSGNNQTAYSEPATRQVSEDIKVPKFERSQSEPTKPSFRRLYR